MVIQSNLHVVIQTKLPSLSYARGAPGILHCQREAFIHCCKEVQGTTGGIPICVGILFLPARLVSAPVLLPPRIPQEWCACQIQTGQRFLATKTAPSSGSTGSARVTQREQLTLHHLQTQFLRTCLRGLMLGTGVPAGSRNCQGTVLVGLLWEKDSVG